ncbi:MAG: hypothetical protein V4537_17185 [Pseudomonadota bacterium]
MATGTEFEAEVDRNFDAFLTLLPTLLRSNKGEFALMRHGETTSFHSDEATALAAGRGAFSDRLFSVQEVTDRPVDLGFFSHAINSRIA